MSIAWKTALWRFVWIFLFGGAATLGEYLAGHLADFNLPLLFIPIATAALAAVVKFVKERLKAQTG